MTSQEFIITDPQGNARLSFQNNGSGTAVVKQENSYYGFGLIMANSPVPLPGTPNKQLYNGGSEWQNDYSNLPDYDQTFYRNYDAALGRWVAVDPVAESAESMSSYQYAGDNPIMMNDPDGDLLPYPGSHSAAVDWSSYESQAYWQGTGGVPANVQQTFNSETDADGGLYVTDPEAYGTGYYLGGGTFGGKNVYHAGDGTLNDPASGINEGQLGSLFAGGHSWEDYTSSTSNTTTVNDNKQNDLNGVITIGSKKVTWANIFDGADDGNQEGNPPGWWQSFKNFFHNGYDNGSKANAAFGAAGWSMTLAKSVKIIRIEENANYAVLGLAETMDLIALYNHYRYGNGSPNSITLPKFLENLGFGIAGFSKYLSPIAVIYFGLDAFYPGGANGWVQGWEIHPDFSHIGEPNQDTDHN